MQSFEAHIISNEFIIDYLREQIAKGRGDDNLTAQMLDLRNSPEIRAILGVAQKGVPIAILAGISPLIMIFLLAFGIGIHVGIASEQSKQEVEELSKMI